MTDPVSDMLTRIRNAYLAKKQSTVVSQSKLNQQVAIKLKQLGYISDHKTKIDEGKKTLLIKLKYKQNLPVITQIKRISKPGRRVYQRFNQIRPVLSGYGASIVSTNQGVLTDKEARKAKIGGEVICQVW